MPENLTSSGPGIAGTMIKISYRAVAGQTGLANKSPFVTDSMSKARIRGGFSGGHGWLGVRGSIPASSLNNSALPTSPDPLPNLLPPPADE